MIKLVHLLCVPEHEREVNSVKCLEQLEPEIKYIKHVNPPYKEKPPVKTCHRPHAVTHRQGQRGQLWCGHYGAFLAHKRAVIEEFDADFLMICECDCQITIPHLDFINEVKEACQFIEQENISYLSFGNNEPNIKYSSGKFTVTPDIFKTHCILFPKKTKDFLINSFNNAPWDNIDFFYNRIFRDRKIAISNQQLAVQVGESLIDIKIKL